MRGNGMAQRNYLQIKQDVQDISQSEMERMLNDPGLSHLWWGKGKSPIALSENVDIFAYYAKLHE